MNEANENALGFYLHFGFEVAGRSELDSAGRPFPLLHLVLIALHHDRVQFLLPQMQVFSLILLVQHPAT